LHSSSSLDVTTQAASSSSGCHVAVGDDLPWEVSQTVNLRLDAARVVCARKGGGFCQVRSDLKTARLVLRGYRALLPSDLGPHEPLSGWECLQGMPGVAATGIAGAGIDAKMAGYRRQIGQAAMDNMSVMGLQNMSGALVHDPTQAAPKSGGSEGQGPFMQQHTDAQLEYMRQTRARAASSLQTAAHTSHDQMAGVRVSMEVLSRQTIRKFAEFGEKLPPVLSPIGRPTMQLIGQMVGFTSVIGSWIVGGSSQVVCGALGATERAADASIRAAEASLSGLQTVMSAAQTEFVLGVEGAAIMENLINIHEAEFRHIYTDIGYMQLARGMSAYTCLQQLARPNYLHDGVVDSLGPGMRGDTRSVSIDRPTLALWLRYMRLSSCAYGVSFMTITGVTDPKNLLLGDVRTLFERTGITEDNIIHACWQTEGYAAPAWLLVQDDLSHAVCLVISGSKNNSDWLSNLRCANVEIKSDHIGPLVPRSEEEIKCGISVHAGIWAAAVKMDERCLEIVTKAMGDRPGWPLVICGHSLGAATGSLVGMRWRGNGLFPGLKVYAFGVPPIISSTTIARDAHEYITSFQCSDDFVTRWCLGTSRDIFKAAHALASAEGVVDQLVDASLYGLQGLSDPTTDSHTHTQVEGDARDTQGRRPFAASRPDDYASQVKHKNRALFDSLLLQQKHDGTLPAYAVDAAKPYLLSIRKADVVTKEWVDKTLEACHERMDSDKLIPTGKCYWLVPILNDAKTFKERRASWGEMADGANKCKVHILNPDNSM